jgi:hypothetical protein
MLCCSSQLLGSLFKHINCWSLCEACELKARKKRVRMCHTASWYGCVCSMWLGLPLCTAGSTVCSAPSAHDFARFQKCCMLACLAACGAAGCVVRTSRGNRDGMVQWWLTGGVWWHSCLRLRCSVVLEQQQRVAHTRNEWRVVSTE